MREIKFRAWDKENREMLYQGSNATHNNGAMECQIIFDQLEFGVFKRVYAKEEYVYCKNCELMQYTGLKDKNGREIYEGDIFYIDYGDGQGEYFVVEYNDGYFRLVDSKSRECYTLNEIYDDQDAEIVGNIHDNPELLKPECKEG